MSLVDKAAARPGVRLETVFIAGVLLLAFGAFLYISTQRQTQLRDSPSGLNGLAVWLKSQEIEAQNFFGGWPVETEAVGMNIIPLYDTDLDRDRSLPETQEELLFQVDEYDLSSGAIRNKLRLVPSMVILPKWHTGMRLTTRAHPILLIDPTETSALLRSIAGEHVGAVRQIPSPFTRFSYANGPGIELTAELYIAQVFDGYGCQPIIGEQGRMLLGACPLSDSNRTFLVLADPDLMNNHGLRLGENAWIARDLLKAEASEKTVFIDYSRQNWFTEATDDVLRERSWADLLRFFAYPFTLLWLSAGMMLALTLWRASFRFGPVLEEREGLEISRAQVIQVRGRLLRLTGQEGALLHEYATARLSATAAKVFGQNYLRHTKDEEALLRHAARQEPALADRLKDSLDQIRRLPSEVTAGEAIRYVDNLEVLLEQLTHDT
ncbi:MAG: hypothetical protein AAGC81_07825 [Pseudomonadota bacterium]